MGANGWIKWDERKTEQAFRLALLGAREVDMAVVMGISIKTLEYWKRNRPEFTEAVRQGKMEADSKVAESLYKRATGYTIKQTHISVHKGKVTVTEYDKNIPPDAWACMKWLGLRQRTNWTDVQKTELVQTNVNINKFDFSGLTTEELKMLKKIGIKQLVENVGDN